MANEWGHAERDAVCPVPLEKLGQLHRADPEGVLALVAEIPESALGSSSRSIATGERTFGTWVSR